MTSDDPIERILSRAGTAIQPETPNQDSRWDQLELEERSALRRVGGLSTELVDVSEVEYRQLRLERVVLIGLFGGGVTQLEAEVSLRELAALAETAGSQILDGILQRRQAPDPATFLGSGKAQEVAALVAELGADTVVADAELAPSQRRALEDVLKVKVVDRTAVILDIFAAHAKSKEGKMQVELAQLEYLLPRLRGWGESMSRQAGGRVAAGAGIGSRGPGETKIELDRRRIRTRMAKLRRDLAQTAPARRTRRAKRRRANVPAVAIVGYTNAGKSSLLNALTGAGVMVDNTLFATLDPTVRQTHTADGRVYTLADTVGFVRNLPHELVEAFRSTLEEAVEADVWLHVVDAAHPDPEGQITAVRTVLRDLKAADAVGQGPGGSSGNGLGEGLAGAVQAVEILALNKADLAPSEVVAGLLASHRGAVAISANSGDGLDQLRQMLDESLPRPQILVETVVPYLRGDLVSRAHEEGEVISQDHQADGTHLTARVGPALAAELERAASS
ncbi:MAG: GTPase HflX [Micrococcales bacterium]|nr:GTPase HflX [Micrococcales bacterium]